MTNLGLPALGKSPTEYARYIIRRTFELLGVASGINSRVVLYVG